VEVEGLRLPQPTTITVMTSATKSANATPLTFTATVSGQKSYRKCAFLLEWEFFWAQQTWLVILLSFQGRSRGWDSIH